MENLLRHYHKLWFYNFNRFKGENFKLMREYFAHILIKEVEEFIPLDGKKVLDVGGARGEFCKIMAQLRKCDAVNLDPSPYVYGPYQSNFIWPRTAIGIANSMPFRNDQFDLVICRGVLEHIPREKQQCSLNEMHRVMKKRGICYVAIPPWFSPWGGHGLKPFHYFPFKVAKFLAELAYRKKINATSWEQKNLFPITFNKMLTMVSASGFRVITTKDTHFRLHLLTKIPILRDIVVPNLVFILSKM